MVHLSDASFQQLTRLQRLGDSHSVIPKHASPSESNFCCPPRSYRLAFSLNPSLRQTKDSVENNKCVHIGPSPNLNETFLVVQQNPDKATGISVRRSYRGMVQVDPVRLFSPPAVAPVLLGTAGLCLGRDSSLCPEYGGASKPCHGPMLRGSRSQQHIGCAQCLGWHGYPLAPCPAWS